MTHLPARESLRRHRGVIARTVCGVAAVVGAVAAISGAASAQGTPPVPVVPNPPLTARCGALKIMLVLDESSSIGAVDLGTIRTAANAFVTGLVGTDTDLGISAFARGARNLTNPVYDRVTDVTAAGGPTGPGMFRAAIRAFGTNVPFGGRAGTNWDDAFRLIREDDDVTGVVPNLVVFMTDGNPNTFGPGNNLSVSPNESPAGWDAATPASIQSANSVKIGPAGTPANPKGSRIFAIGLGSALNAEQGSHDRLMWISGNREYPQTPFFSADWTINDDFAAFEQILQNITGGLCGSSLQITKYVSGVHGAGLPSAGTKPEEPWRPADDWDFTTTLHGDHTWLSPVPSQGANHPSATATTGSAGVPGEAGFFWSLPSEEHSVTLSNIHETGKPGFHHVLSTCLIHRPLADGGWDLIPHPEGGSVTGILGGAVLRPDEFMTCDVFNAPDASGNGGGDKEDVDEGPNAPHLAVHKTMPAHAHVGDHVPITITVRNIGHGTAHTVILHESRLAGLRIVAVANHGSLQHDGTAVWHLGDLAPGATRTVHATAVVTHTGLHPDTAVASASNADPAFSNAHVRAAAATRPTTPTRRPSTRPPAFTG